MITTTNYVFSADVINKTKEILNKDINFLEIYNNIVNSNKVEEKELESTVVENNENSACQKGE